MVRTNRVENLSRQNGCTGLSYHSLSICVFSNDANHLTGTLHDCLVYCQIIFPFLSIIFFFLFFQSTVIWLLYQKNSIYKHIKLVTVVYALQVNRATFNQNQIDATCQLRYQADEAIEYFYWTVPV